MDGLALRAAFARFPSGVTALSALVDGVPEGMAVSAFLPVSLSPPLLAVSLQRTSRTWPVLRRAGGIGVSVLAAHQESLGRRLSGPAAARFTGVDWTATGSGAVRVGGAAAFFDCELDEEVPAGDHVIALLAIRAADHRPAVPPLVFHASGFHQLV